MSLPKETRVAILFFRFGPYHHARLNAAGQVMSVWGIEACASDNIYAWDKVEGAADFKRITLMEQNADNAPWRRELRRKMRGALDEIKPQAVVIPGWIFADALSALEWCADTNVPVVIMSESTAWDESRVFWKEWVKGRLVKMCAAGLAGGTAHAEYLVQLGMEKERVFLGYDIVDNDYFAAKAEESRKRKAESRKQLGLPDKYFLACARFIGKKNLVRLIEAYARYREQARNSDLRPPTSDLWDLVILGDGPLKSDLCHLISRLGLQHSVHLPGFKQYHELPAYLGLAGAFVHASTTEQWGLVVNEAMAAGLPVLVSNRCGCAQDLVQEGINGFTFDPGDTEALAGLLQKISAPGFPLATFGSESRRLIGAWGPDRFASGLQDAVKAALKANRHPVGLVDRLILGALLRRSRT